MGPAAFCCRLLLSPLLDVLCEIAQCPLSGGRLIPLSSDELSALNKRIETGSLSHADGTVVREALGQAVRSDDGHVVYRVDGGIAALLPELAITLAEDRGNPRFLDPANRVVQDFYDSFGWLKEGDHYLDTLTFVDVRPISMEYLERCHRRIRRHLPARGRFMLDAASGPVQYDEYRRLSEGFRFRVCVDFSARALHEAQLNLGDHGLYILGDVTVLPLRAESVDAAVSLHTIYHLKAEQQATAFEELYRVLKPAASAVVVYEWGRRRIVRRALAKGVRTLGLARRRRSAEPHQPTPPPLFAHKHTCGWFRKQNWSFDPDVRSWSSVRGPFLRRFVHERFFGGQLLELLYRLEEWAPHLAGRFGRYPMIVIRKQP